MTKAMVPRALLLDLDGTLIDSAPDIADALNHVLADQQRHALPERVVRTLIGHGIPRLVERAFIETGEPLDPAALALAQSAMMARYAAALTVRTTLMPGAEPLVALCLRHDIELACITNKPGQMARDILRHFGLLDHFALVIGGDGALPRKPAPDGLLHIMATLGLSRDECWMVGDGLPDMQAGRVAGIRTVAVPSDYGEGALDPGLVDIEVAGLAGLAAMIETGISDVGRAA